MIKEQRIYPGDKVRCIIPVAGHKQDDIVTIISYGSHNTCLLDSRGRLYYIFTDNILRSKYLELVERKFVSNLEKEIYELETMGFRS